MNSPMSSRVRLEATADAASSGVVDNHRVHR